MIPYRAEAHSLSGNKTIYSNYVNVLMPSDVFFRYKILEHGCSLDNCELDKMYSFAYYSHVVIKEDYGKYIHISPEDLPLEMEIWEKFTLLISLKKI